MHYCECLSNGLILQRSAHLKLLYWRLLCMIGQYFPCLVSKTCRQSVFHAKLTYWQRTHTHDTLRLSLTHTPHSQRAWAGWSLHMDRHSLFIALFPKVFLTGTGAEQESNVSSPVFINHSLLIQTCWKRQPSLHLRKKAHFVFWKRKCSHWVKPGLKWTLSRNQWVKRGYGITVYLWGKCASRWAIHG